MKNLGQTTNVVNLVASGNVTGVNLSGTNTGDQSWISFATIQSLAAEFNIIKQEQFGFNDPDMNSWLSF